MIHIVKSCEIRKCRICNAVKWLVTLKKEYPSWSEELRDDYMLNNEIGKMP